MRVLWPLLLCSCLNAVDETGVSPAAGSPSPGTYRSAWVNAACGKWVRCWAAGSVATCLENPHVLPEAPDLARHLAEGTIRFDPAHAQRCLDSFATSDCSTGYFTGVDDCSLTYEGMLPVGQPCTNLECTRSTFCAAEAASDAGLGCRALCQPRVGEGQPAPTAEACEFGLVLAGGSCQRPRGRGERCDAVTQPCDLAQGLFCGPSSTCLPGLALGAACDSGRRCGAFTVCENGTCTRAFDVGHRCGDAAATAGLFLTGCKLDLTCAGATCREALAEGGRCLGTDECRGDLRCSAQGECVTPAADGESCVSRPCASFDACDSDRVCRSRVGLTCP